jgi:hypothetical protein
MVSVKFGEKQMSTSREWLRNKMYVGHFLQTVTFRNVDMTAERNPLFC